MQANIIPIGNSKGIRIPKALLKQYHLTGSADIKMTKKGLLITPSPKRQNWSDAFKQTAKNQKDKVQDFQDPINDWDQKDWQW